NAHWIAAIGRAVRSRLPLHDALLGDERADGHAAAETLRRQHNVRRNPGVIVSPHFSGTPHAGLHLVEDQHDSVLVANALKFLQEKRRRRDEAAFALNRLYDNRRNLFRREQPLEDLLLEQFDDLSATGFLGVAERAAVGVGEGNVLHAAKQSAEILALRTFRGRKRKRAERAPVEAAIERNQFVASRGIARQLDRAFYRLCAAIAEEYLVVVRLRHGGDEALRELRHVPVIEIRAGNVDELRRLLLNGLHHMGVAMAGGADRDARGKIQESVAVGIFNNRAVAAMSNQLIFAKQRWRNIFLVVLDHFLCLGAGQRHIDSGEFCFRGRNHDASKFCAQWLELLPRCGREGRLARARILRNLLKMKDLIYAEQAGTQIRWTKLPRHARAHGDSIMFQEMEILHLRFQRTLPSLASSKSIPRSASSLRMRSLAAKSRRWRAAWRSATSFSIAASPSPLEASVYPRAC